MAEHPILFSAPMIRAILAGTKTQTRRVIRDQPTVEVDGAECQVAAPSCIDLEPGTHFWRWLERGGVSRGFLCPYGQPGHQLWVRETFTPRYFDDGRPAYRADFDAKLLKGIVPEPSWKPSIFMPRAASRITLEITDVWVEPLRRITDEDAMAEGVDPGQAQDGLRLPGDYRAAFRALWDTINGKRAPWSSNPWLWVVVFKRVVAHADGVAAREVCQ